jgi:tetratricopeptide (TPR) repeat protein
VAPPPDEEVVEIDLEGEDLTGVLAEGEELAVEVEGETEAAAELEPASVADARELIRRGAAVKAAEFLQEHLGANPRDFDAWAVLAEARRTLGDLHGVRDALLRVADMHRRDRHFEEAHAAYRGALDADPRSVAAVRGLSELLLEEEAAAAPPAAAPAVASPAPPAPPPADEEEITLDLFEQEGEAQPAGTGPELEPGEADKTVEAVAAEPFAAQAQAASGAEDGQEPELELEVPGDAAEAAAGPAPEEPVPEAAPGRFEEFEDFLEQDAGAAAPDEPPFAVPAPAGPAEAEFDLEALGDALSEAAAILPVTPPAHEMEPSAAAVTLAEEMAVADEPTPEAPPVHAARVPPAPAIATPPTAPAVSHEFEEFLAEADFYFQQGLIDEAEFLYKKLLQLSPGNADVSRRLEKLEESRGPLPAASEAGEGVQIGRASCRERVS